MKERAKAFGLVEALLFTTSKTALWEWKVAPSISIYIPAIIIGVQGAIGTLTEWQNLYPRREIMVLGANEQVIQAIANRASGVSGRGLRRRGR
jgi:hypothetical protein